MPGGNGNGTGTGSGNGPLQLNKTGSAGSGIDTSPAPQPAQMSRTESSAPVPPPEMETQSRSATVSAMQQTPMIQITAAQREDYMMRTQSEFQVSVSETIEMLGRQLQDKSYDQGKTFLHWKRNPSSQMQGVLKAIDSFNTMMKQPIVTQRFDMDLKRLQTSYLGITQSCDTYFKTHHNPKTDEGQFRFNHVKRIHEIAVRELALLEHNAEYYRKTKTTGLWSDVVKEERTMVYEAGTNGVSITQKGGGTTSLDIIDDGVQKHFFKPDAHTTVVDPATVAQEVIDSYEHKQHLPSEVAKYDSKKKILERLRDSLSAFKLRSPDAYENFIQNCKDQLTSVRNISLFAFTNAGEDIDGVTDLYRYYEAKRQQGKMADWNLFTETIVEFGKQVNFNYMAMSVAEMKSGTNVTSRNALTSRMADFLGISSLVVKSSVAKMRINGDNAEGIVMEEAKGVSLDELFHDEQLKGKKLSFSPEVLRELTTLQVFDVLCGQVDRNKGNILYQYRVEGDEVIVEHLTGIDNDMSFGELSHKRARGDVSGHVQEIQPIYVSAFKDPNHRNIVGLDKGFADLLLGLDQSQLDFMTADVLSKEEREMLGDRLRGIQADIRRLMQEETEGKGKRIFSTTAEWQSLRDAIESMDETDKPGLHNCGYMKREMMGYPIGFKPGTSIELPPLED